MKCLCGYEYIINEIGDTPFNLVNQKTIERWDTDEYCYRIDTYGLYMCPKCNNAMFERI